MAPPKTKDAPRGTIQGSLYNGLLNYTIRAAPLPQTIIAFLQSHTNTIAHLLASRQNQLDSEEELREERDTGDDIASAEKILSGDEFWEELGKVCDAAGGEWVGAADRIWTFGPKRMGANILLDPIGTSLLR